MLNERITRRDFLRIGAALGGAALVSACDSSPQPSPIRPIRAAPTEALPIVAPQPDLLRLFSESSQYAQEIKSAAAAFMSLETPQRDQRNQRTSLEENLFKILETNNAPATDVLLALQAAGTVEARGWGMQLLWQKRQVRELSQFGIEPLDERRISWALANGIDPRMLAIARDTSFAALELLKAAPDKFFEAVPQNQRGAIRFEDTLPNPGVIAKLNMTETGNENLTNPNPINRYWGYVFIGGGAAWKELNLEPDWFPKGQDHLKIIAQVLQDQTGLPYRDNVESIPGSERDPECTTKWEELMCMTRRENPYLMPNGSGGAIGPQFMPINALLFMDWYKIANERLGNKYPPVNPFDPFTGTILSYLYLASEWYGRHGDYTDSLTIVRPGYRASRSDDEKILALMKWNPTYQAPTALEAGYDYFRNFGRI